MSFAMKRYQASRWLQWHACKPIFRFALFFWPAACTWHKGMFPENWSDSSPSCPECGCLLDTKLCPRCGKDFLDFGGNHYDDVMASPSVTSGGDLACCRCASRMEREEEEGAYNDSPEYDYDPYSEEEVWEGRGSPATPPPSEAIKP